MTICIFCVTYNCFPQQSQIFKKYANQFKNKGELPFPDFSYAGYRHGVFSEAKENGRRFFVTDYGAIPNDDISDKSGIEDAINAAISSGGGTVIFPVGKYILIGKNDIQEPLIFRLNSAPISLLGQGGKVELVMERELLPREPKKLWTTPYMLEFTGKKKEVFLTEIIRDSKLGDKLIYVKDTSNIEVDNWILLTLKDNSPDLIKSELKNLDLDEAWTFLIDEGTDVQVMHQVAKVLDGAILLKEPLLKNISSKYNWNVYSVFKNLEFLIKDLDFIGHWNQEFIHHKNALHDGGYSALALSNLINFRVKNCSFTNVNRAISVNASANGSITSCDILGNGGHSAISIHNSTRVFVGANKDIASQWHTFGVGKASIGNVFWRNEHAKTTSFESHASQPRATLIDCAKGGFLFGRLGGARFNLPNHMEYLVLWNYNETDDAEQGYEFWSSKSWYGKVIPPIIVGFHGSGTTFKEEQLEHIESKGIPVSPESLYEAQLLIRLGAMPNWLKNLKSRMD